MNKILTLILITFLFVGCSKKSSTDQLPIPEEKVILVLTDLYILQARIDTKSKNSLNELTITKDSIYTAHQVSTEHMEIVFKLLKSDQALLATIQKKVEVRISQMERGLSLK